jgi:integrase
VRILIIVLTEMASVWRHPRSRYWTACFYDAQGKLRRVSTKESNKKEAQRIANGYEKVARTARTLRQVRTVFDQLHEEITGQRAVTTSVRAFTDSWLAAKQAETAAATMAFYRRTVTKLLASIGPKAELPISQIHKSDILEFRSARAKEVSPRTANHDLKCVKMIFKAARREEVLSEDPSEFVETVRQRGNGTDGNGRRAFTLPELRRILDVADPEWKSLIWFGFHSAQRLGDLALLRWSNIDLLRSEIRLTTRKTGRPMLIPLSAPLRRHIESLPTRALELNAPVHPRAFQTVTEQGRTSSLSNQFANLLAACGLRETRSHQSRDIGRSAPRTGSQLSFHSLRRTATTLLHERGIPSAVAQAFIGHDSPDVHDGYISVGRTALELAAATLPEI